MLIITSKLPWRRQPTAPVRVNWSHPLASDLVAWMLPQDNTLVNLAREVLGVCNEVSRSGFTIDALENRKVNIRSSETGIINLGSGSFIQSKSKITLINELNRTSSNNCVGGWCFGEAGNTYRTLLSIHNTNFVFFLISSSNYGSVAYANSPVAMMAGVFDGTLTGNDNRCKLFINGRPQTLTFTGTIPTATQSYLPNANLGSPYFNVTTGNGTIGNSLIYLRALDELEIQSLYDNPYQMLAPTHSRRYFIPLGGGGPQTIAVTTGDGTGIGYSFGTVQPRAIGLTAGSETGLGYALSIVQSHSIAFTAGQETGEGYQAGLVQPRSVGLVEGQETGIGYTLGTIQPRAIGFAAGSETGVGYALGVSAGAGRTIDVTAGTETGAGYSLGVIQPRTIGVSAGSETGIGYALGVSAGGARTIEFTAGQETGIGYALGVAQPHSIGLATGSETGIGYSLGVQQGTTIAPPRLRMMPLRDQISLRVLY